MCSTRTPIVPIARCVSSLRYRPRCKLVWAGRWYILAGLLGWWCFFVLRFFREFFQLATPRDFKPAACSLSYDVNIYIYIFFIFAHFYFPASGQAVVTGVIPSPPRFLPSILIAHRVQQSHCSSIFHRTLLTHALALSAGQFVHKKKSQRI